MYRSSFLILCVLFSAALVVGCGGPNRPSTGEKGGNPQPQASDPADSSQQAGKNNPGKDSEHGHKAGQFGGIIVPVGRDNYHAEAVFEKSGVVRLYTLGQDEARVIEVEAKGLTAYAKPEGATEAEEFRLEPDRREDDSPGKTSRFKGTLPSSLWGKRVEVTIPTLWINRERFRVGFKSSTETHKEVAMPPSVTGENEKQLFLTPAGKYTQADIEANKNQTPSQKFRDFVAEHDADPKPGDLICPVTSTKANPECAWVIDGQTYYFCCPPCVTDFVKTAKTKPDKIKKAADYRKLTAE